MAGNEIKIVIGGDASSFVQASNQSAASTDALQKTIAAASAKIDTSTDAIRHSFDEVAASKAAMDRISAAIDAAADAATKAGPSFNSLGGRLPLQDFNKFSASVSKLKSDLAAGVKPKIEIPKIPPIPPVPNPFKEVPKGANQAAAALTNIGRVAQDLPFGFVGIQNNLNPLLESFQRLKAETGSSKEAFKALGSSLIGAGGIGLALSVVSSAIVIFQNGIAGFNSKTKEARDKTEEFLKTLKDVADVAGAAAASEAGNIAQVQALANVVTNGNNSYEARKRALEELKQVNKAYFGDLKLEEGQMGALTAKVDEYTKALVAQAVVKGFSEEIARVSVELAKQDKVLRGNTDEVNRLRAALANTKQSETSLTGEDRVSQKYVNTKNALEDANDAFSAQYAVVSKLRANLDDLQGSIDGAVKESLKFQDLNPGKSTKEEDALKKRIEALKQLQSLTGLDAGQQVLLAQLEIQLVNRDAAKLGFTQAEAQQQIQGILEKAFPVGTFEFDTVVTTRVNKLEPSKIQKPVALSEGQKIDIAKAIGLETIEIPAPNLIFLNLKDKSIAALDQLNKAITDASASAVDSFAEGIGNAIVGKGDIFSSLFTIMADGLMQIGKALLAYGLALIGFKVALKSLNPVVAIAAGAAAIVAGAALKASIPKFADGGIATRSTLGIFGEAGKEAIIPLDRLPELLGRINVNNQSDVALAPTFRVSLTDLELGLERVRTSRRRLG